MNDDTHTAPTPRAAVSADSHSSRLSVEAMEAILSVTRALATPFDLHTMLAEVAAVARQVMSAERVSVWLHDPATNDLYVEVASDLPPIRVPMGVGFVGTCARDRAAINVPDAHADPRFNAEIDRKTGFHTRCILTLPLIDHQGQLVGVLQLLNKGGGPFDATDMHLAEALAAQCAVALARVRMTQAVIAGELMRQEAELAGVVQRSTLPAGLPVIDGYAAHTVFRPASLTGGDTYDLSLIDQGLLIVLADATGHGLGPALSVTRMHAMLRMAFRLGASLETAFCQVNDQLVEVLPDGHFVTAFIGLLDPLTHRLRFLSGGQGPILHFQAASTAFAVYRATSFPLGAGPIVKLKPTVEIDLAPGDWLVLLSDGIYEWADPAEENFGRARVEAVVRAHAQASPEAMTRHLLDAAQAHARGAPQDDDVTMVLIKRQPGA